MWHEARRQEKKIRGMLVDYRKRADRRKEFYEKIVSKIFFHEVTLKIQLKELNELNSIPESRSKSVPSNPRAKIKNSL